MKDGADGGRNGSSRDCNSTKQPSNSDDKSKMKLEMVPGSAKKKTMMLADDWKQRGR